ncbi:13690_t:CDS:2 [Rhizophagus irregularis]|nr:13690_t:CDS:2 [Rhizophagus irregularis]
MKKFTNKPIEYFDIVQINTNNKRKATKNVELKLKELGPDFIEKTHSQAFYTSRSLNSFISFNSSSLISTPVYITKEYDFDINS